MAVVGPQDQEIRIRCPHACQACLAARQRLCAEVFKPDRLVPERRDQAWEGIALLLQATSHTADEDLHEHIVLHAVDPASGDTSRRPSASAAEDIDAAVC